jgi:hypothetical protein
MRRLWAWTISATYVALVVACSSDPCQNAPAPGTTTEKATCQRWIQRLLDCEVIAGTRLSGCQDDDPILPCTWACMQKATCKQIKSSYCNNSFNSYAGCLNECHESPPPFVCDDGTQINALRQCDGVSDCPNGEDEDCTQGYFTCNDGKLIPESWVCDNSIDCTGGEDEAGCPPPPMATCETGESILASAECNGVPDCPDGDDEANCARLTCDSP